MHAWGLGCVLGCMVNLIVCLHRHEVLMTMLSHDKSCICIVMCITMQIRDGNGVDCCRLTCHPAHY